MRCCFLFFVDFFLIFTHNYVERKKHSFLLFVHHLTKLSGFVNYKLVFLFFCINATLFRLCSVCICHFYVIFSLGLSPSSLEYISWPHVSLSMRFINLYGVWHREPSVRHWFLVNDRSSSKKYLVHDHIHRKHTNTCINMLLFNVYV